MIRKFWSFCKNNEAKIDKFVPWFLMFFFITLCLPYVFARNSTLNNIFSNSTISYIIRFLFLTVFSIFGLFLHILKKIIINYPIVICLLVLFCFSLISNFVSPDNIVSYSFYFTGKINMTVSKIGVFEKLLDSFRFTGGLIIFYFLYQAFPSSFHNRNSFTYVLLPPLIIALIGVLYSFVFERNLLINALEGYGNTDIKSIFHSKNAYGIFLLEGSISTFFISFYDKRKWFKLLLFLLPVFLIVSYLISCKLAFVCILVLLLFAYIYTIIIYFKTKIIISVVLLSVSVLISVFLVVLFSVPQIRESGFLKNLYEKLLSEFKNFNISSFIGRTSEWSVVPVMTSGIFIVIGFSRAVGYSVVNGYTSINGTTSFNISDLHNAYIDFYAYHGVVGVTVLGAIYLLVFYKIFKLFKFEKGISLLLIIIFLVSILFGMAETYTLFLSMSANTFALNVILLSVLSYELKEKGVKTCI